MNAYGSADTNGDKFDGLTRKVGFDRMIPPHALEVCFEKTTHIIFPSEVVYVDLGNENLVLETHIIDVKGNVGSVLQFRVEVEKSIIRVDGFQKKLHPETL